MTTQATTHRAQIRGRRRRAVIVSLALGVAMAGVVAMAGAAQEAQAAFPNKVVFVSHRTEGAGVDNPTRDAEIFTMNPDGTGVKQLTFNTGGDSKPTLSPDGTTVAYESYGDQASNPEGDYEVYVINASDGKGKKNLTNNGTGVRDEAPDFSPDGTKIAYQSQGIQDTNPEGDAEIYRMNSLDGTNQTNLTNSASGVSDIDPDYSPNGTKIAYRSYGKQTSNLDGDGDIYLMGAADGSGQTNLTHNGAGVADFFPIFSPDGTKIAYATNGEQSSNSEGDTEVYRMNAVDGTGKKNLTDNGAGIGDYRAAFSPGGEKIAYQSYGEQTSNPQGDKEIYRMNTLDGLGKKNLSNNRAGADEDSPDFSPSGKTVVYESEGVQNSNLEGDDEIYRVNVLDGLGKKNLTNNTALDFYAKWGR